MRKLQDLKSFALSSDRQDLVYARHLIFVSGETDQTNIFLADSTAVSMPGCKFLVGLMQLTMQLCSRSHSIKSVLQQLFSTITITIANLSASPAVVLAMLQVFEVAWVSCIN